MLIAAAGFIASFLLIIFRVPIAVALGATGFVGFGYLVGWKQASVMLGIVTRDTAMSYTLAVIPLFVLMGNFVIGAGVSQEIFRSARLFLGHHRGGLAMAAISASAGFATVCGSTFATVATIGRLSMPAMRSAGYRDSFGAAAIAAGSTLGIMIPPSTLMVVYAILTETNVGALYAASLIPSVIGLIGYLLAVMWVARRSPEKAPRSERAGWGEAIASLKPIWSVAVLFAFVLGGIFLGWFTATESAGIGAAGAFVLTLLRGRMSFKILMESLYDAVATTAIIFGLIIGAVIFTEFLNYTGAHKALLDFVANSGFSPLTVILIICTIYVFLGAIMEELSMILLTVPLFFPVVVGMGYDPVWFGVVVIALCEVGLICPPLGLNLFVIRVFAPEIPIGQIMTAITPFVVADILRVVLLVLVPALSLWLPTILY